jgi:GDP-L-fucose synthase
MALTLNEKLLITGGTGFLGSRVVEAFKNAGYTNILVPTSKEFDLKEQSAVRKLLSEQKPSTVIHLAAHGGGIQANLKNPGSFFYDNAIMGIMLMEESRRVGVAKFVTIGTVCAYPKNAPVPFCETDLWQGYPEETNAPYGLAKKMLLTQGQAYRQQYEFNAIYLLPANLYGPGDNFDPEYSHVIPALIKKFLHATKVNESEVEVWGDSTASREFLFVDDCARAIKLASEKLDSPEPVNIGTGKEISIKELAALIARLTNFKGKVVWNHSKPNGQPRRRLNIEQAKKLFGFESQTLLEEGLIKTIAWYKASSKATGEL